jgi:hypothetical protein
MSSDVVVNMLTRPLAGGSGSQFPVETIFYFLLITEWGSGSPPFSYSVGTEGVFLDKEAEVCYLYSRVRLCGLHRSQLYFRKVAIVLGPIR